MAAEQIGAIFAKLMFPALGILTAYYIMKDFKIKKQAKKEGITYKEMKKKLNLTKLKDGGKE